VREDVTPRDWQFRKARKNQKGGVRQIYRMTDHPGREITLIYGDAVPTFQGKKVKSHPGCQKSQARLTQNGTA
jgi:hypothetical protein